MAVEEDLALIVLRDTIAEFANARGWDPDDEEVVATVTGAYGQYRSGKSLTEVCDDARAKLWHWPAH